MKILLLISNCVKNILLLFFSVVKVQLQSFPAGTILVDRHYSAILCGNCGLRCGKIVDEKVTLNRFRITIDIPTETVRVCQRIDHSDRRSIHRHNYLHRMTSLTITNGNDMALCEQFYKTRLYSQLWNGPFHRVTCRIPSPCVRSKVKTLKEDDVGLAASMPIDLSKRHNSMVQMDIDLSNEMTQSNLAVAESQGSIVKSAMIDPIDMSQSTMKKISVLSDEIVHYDSSIIKSQVSNKTSNLVSDVFIPTVMEPQPSTSNYDMPTVEPQLSTSKALDSALLTNEFELLSAARKGDGEDFSTHRSRYLTRSKYSSTYKRIFYHETERRYVDKHFGSKKSTKKMRKNAKSFAFESGTVQETDDHKNGSSSISSDESNVASVENDFLTVESQPSVCDFEQKSNVQANQTNVDSLAVTQTETTALSCNANENIPSYEPSAASGTFYDDSVGVGANSSGYMLLPLDNVNVTVATSEITANTSETIGASTNYGVAPLPLEIASGSTNMCVSDNVEASNVDSQPSLPILSNDELYRLFFGNTNEGNTNQMTDESDFQSFLNDYVDFS